MELDKEKFSKAINEKMHQIMFDRKEKLGLRYFAGEIGVSLATFHRVTDFKDFDLKTFFKLMTWLDKPINDFII